MDRVRGERMKYDWGQQESVCGKKRGIDGRREERQGVTEEGTDGRRRRKRRKR